MSKFLPDPQIQSLRAMRAGDISIALPTPLVMTIGTQAVAFVQPEIDTSINVALAAPALVALSGTPSESPVVGVATDTLLSANTLQSESLVAVESLEALSGTPSESPVVGVGFATLVV